MSYQRAKRAVAADNADLRNPSILYNAEKLVRSERQAAGHRQAAETRTQRRWQELFAAQELDREAPPAGGRERVFERRRGLGSRVENIQRMTINLVDPETGELRALEIYMARRDRETNERRASRAAVALAEAEGDATYERIAAFYTAVLAAIEAGDYTMEPAA